jgi:hypothetical protein
MHDTDFLDAILRDYHPRGHSAKLHGGGHGIRFHGNPFFTTLTLDAPPLICLAASNKQRSSSVSTDKNHLHDDKNGENDDDDDDVVVACMARNLISFVSQVGHVSIS